MIDTRDVTFKVLKSARKVTSNQLRLSVPLNLQNYGAI